MSSAENSVSFTNHRESSKPRIRFGYAAKSKVARHHGIPSERKWGLLQEGNELVSTSNEALLIGPMDRYDVGGLLIPHVVSRVLNLSAFRCTGLVSADFGEEGGYPVRNYGESAIEMVGRQLQLIHTGGDTLGRGLISGYAEAAQGEEAERFASLMQIAEPAELNRYVRRRTGQIDDFSYLLSAEGQFFGSQSCFHSVGLSDPSTLTEEMRQRLLSVLAKSSFVGIRDANGAEYLEGQGIAVTRMPCSLSVLPRVCKTSLHEAAESSILKEVKSRFPNGWLTVEVNRLDLADFDRLVVALGSVAEKFRIGLVFVGGDGDDLVKEKNELQRWVSAFRDQKAMAVVSRNIWQRASLVLMSRMLVTDRLNSRILAMAGGIPRIQLPGIDIETESYLKLWEHNEVSWCLNENMSEDWSDVLRAAFKTNPSLLKQQAQSIQDSYFSALDKMCRETGLTAKLLRPGTTRSDNARHVEAHQASRDVADEWMNDSESRATFQRVGKRRRWTGSGRKRAMVQRALSRSLNKKKVNS